MTPDRKPPTAAFWITMALVAVLVGYPLSFGPACWISSRCLKAPLAYRTRIPAIGFIYRPFLNAAWNTKTPWDAVEWYSTVAAPEGWTLAESMEWDGVAFVYLGR